MGCHDMGVRCQTVLQKNPVFMKRCKIERKFNSTIYIVMCLAELPMN